MLGLKNNNQIIKKILVIGASQSCLGIIKTIKWMGYKAVVIGNLVNLPGISIADYYLITDDNNVDDVVSFCQKIKVDGIVPTPVDRPLLWMAKVAKELNLPFIDPSIALNFRHKYKMKQCLQEANIKCAKGLLTNQNKFSPSLLVNFVYPLIVKPINGYASRGVTRANNYEELVLRIKEATSYSSNEEIVIEEFIEGREFNAEGVCFNGKVEVYAIVEKISDPFPRTIEMGHIIPPDISSSEEKIIIDITTKAVLAIGMNNGGFNAEIKVHKGKAYVIEVNGRLAGDFIISHLIKPTTGQDMQEAVVNIALGLPPVKANRNYIKHGMISFFNLPPNKKIKTIKDFNYLHDNSQVIWAFLFFKKGDIIPEVKHMGHRSGFVIVTAEHRKEMFYLAEKTKKTIIDSIIFD